MANRNMPSRGLISKNDSTMRVENAIVEEVFSDNRGIGYILISYGASGQNNMIYMEMLRLNVSRNTSIKNKFGQTLNLRDISKGMRINAEFSSAMTRSIPPQASAFEIVVLADDSSVSVTTDRVVSVVALGGFLYTGNLCDMNEQMKFVVSNTTIILDRNGNRIRLRSLRPCQMVRVEHANFQTMSIPPQTTAFRIQVI